MIATRTAGGDNVVPVPAYAALIRAYECTPLVRNLVKALREQTFPPEEILIVDSSKSHTVGEEFSALGARVIPYPDEDFNYSIALNVGVRENDLPYTLIISSHIGLEDPTLVERGWTKAKQIGAEVCYWTYLYADGVGRERQFTLNRKYFNGRNGLSNSMAFLPTARLKARPFRPEVFSAEDQEWTRYYLKATGLPMLRIESKDVTYLNPNHGTQTWSETKLFNEEIAIGYFVNRRLIMPDRILARFGRGCLAAVRGRNKRARMHFGYAKALFMANLRTPTAQSKYF